MDQAKDAAPWDITRITLGVVAIAGLTAASLWVLKPFLLSGVWATMIVISTWPALLSVQRGLGGRRGLAVAVMTILMLVMIAVPLATAVVALLERADDIVTWTRGLAALAVPGPPDWVRSLPVVGRMIAAEWEKLLSVPSADLASRAAPYVGMLARWLLGQAGSLGTLFVELLLTVVISAILYTNGEAAAAGVLAFARRLAGPAGEGVAILSAQAIRAVAMGIVITALVQAIVGTVGLAVTGVPYPILLGSVMFLFGVAQLGPAPVLIGGIIWLFWRGENVWGTVLVVWSVITMSFDNLLRPILIRRGADLPLLLIFAGVLGGLFAFGLVGLFVGPVLLAVTYTLLSAWVAGSTERADARGQGSG